MPVNTDFVVFGGGPAGSATAIGLARGGAKVLLFERNRSPAFKPGEIIEPSVQHPLRELGLWAEFLALGSLRSAGTLSAWGGAEPIDASSIRNPWGGSFLVDRNHLELCLVNAAIRHGVRVVQAPDSFEFHVYNGRRCLSWSINGHEEQVIPAVFVEATGRGRGVAASTSRKRFDDLVALLLYSPNPAHMRHDTRLYIEAAPEGWWYSAPLPGNIAVSAFLTDTSILPRGRPHRDSFFFSRLKKTSFTRLRYSEGAVCTAIKVAPANSSVRTELSGSDWISVGDAATTYDPLAGLGVVAAMSKGAAIARLLLQEPISVAAETYVESERESFRKYLVMRSRIYAREHRWRKYPFWQARCEL